MPSQKWMSSLRFNIPNSWFRDPSCWWFALKLLWSRLAIEYIDGFEGVVAAEFLYIFVTCPGYPTRRRLPFSQGTKAPSEFNVDKMRRPPMFFRRAQGHPCRIDSVSCITTAHHLVLFIRCLPFSSPTIQVSPEVPEWLIGKQHISRAFPS